MPLEIFLNFFFILRCFIKKGKLDAASSIASGSSLELNSLRLNVQLGQFQPPLAFSGIVSRPQLLLHCFNDRPSLTLPQTVLSFEHNKIDLLRAFFMKRLNYLVDVFLRLGILMKLIRLNWEKHTCHCGC